MTYRDVVPGAVLTQGFGVTDYVRKNAPYGRDRNGNPLPHTGLDLAAPKGTSVNWPVPVKSVYHGWEPRGYGYFAVGTTADGTEILFGHFSEFGSGGLAGKIGSTGNSTGNHTHFEVRKNGRAVDPVAWLASLGVQSGQGANEVYNGSTASDLDVQMKVLWLVKNIGRPENKASFDDVRKNHSTGNLSDLANKFFDVDPREYKVNVSQIYKEAGGTLTEKDFQAKRAARVPYVQLLRELNQANRK